MKTSLESAQSSAAQQADKAKAENADFTAKVISLLEFIYLFKHVIVVNSFENTKFILLLLRNYSPIIKQITILFKVTDLTSKVTSMSTELTSLKAEKEKLTSELMNNSSVSSDRLTQLEAENKDLKVSLLDFLTQIL